MDATTRAALKELKARQAKEANKVSLDLSTFFFAPQYKFLCEGSARFRTAVCSRRAGKCRVEGTLVKTPTGSRAIETLRPGDQVYGYNLDGTVSICEVTQLWDQGSKEVVDLIWNRRVIATSTLDHRWLAYNTYRNTRQVKSLKEFDSRDKIAEEYVPIPGGIKEVKEAYAIGALLGDGCCTCSGVQISSKDEEVIAAVKDSLGFESYNKFKSNNYTWNISNGKPGVRTKIPFYDEWCRGRLAHEKYCDLREIRTWTRKSQLEFIAGLIDTDGSIGITKDGRLTIRFCMQAQEIVDTLEFLLLDLFQCQCLRRVDNREKYKNGPVYEVAVSCNKFSKRILKELPTRVPRKQWKEEYNKLIERNTNDKYIGFKLSNPYTAQCYDITINNDSHLFLDANGLIGHNTVGIAGKMIWTCNTTANAICLYITSTKEAARKIIWFDICRIIKEYAIPCKPNNHTLEVVFPNGARIFIEGAKDVSEIEKFRGWKLTNVFIDEMQSMRSHVRPLIEDVLMPALRDERGQMYLTGTPGPVKAGAFFEYSHNDVWDNHCWTAFENPHMHDPANGKDLNITLAEERAIKKIDETNAAYRRETYGEWVENTDALILHYEERLNDYKEIGAKNIDYIIGADIGWEDSDAIAVLAVGYDTNQVYIVEEINKSKRDVTDFANELKSMIKKYEPIKVVMDAGALGKKIHEELRNRFHINVEAADKSRKLEHLAFLDADMRRGIIRAKKESLFAEDCKLVTMDWSNPERPQISDAYHSDIIDAVLYAYRECQHYIKESKPEPKVAKSLKQIEDEIEEQEDEQLRIQLGGEGDFESDRIRDVWEYGNGDEW